jgi:hypothetical protein
MAQIFGTTAKYGGPKEGTARHKENPKQFYIKRVWDLYRLGAILLLSKGFLARNFELVK